MSGTLVPAPARRVAAQLEAVGCGVEAVGASGWRLSGVPGIEASVDVRVEDRWLVAETDEVGAEIDMAWELVGERDERCGPGSKLVLTPGSRSLRRRAEVRLRDDGAEAVERVLAALARRPERAARLATSLVERCRETGWPVHARESGRIAIDLDVPGAFLQAELAGEDSARAVVRIATLERPAETTRRAIGRFLLGTNGLVRLARGIVGGGADREVVDGGDEAEAAVRFHLGYEVPFVSAPAPEEIEDALLALSSASRRFGRELNELQHEPLARSHLAARPWNS